MNTHSNQNLRHHARIPFQAGASLKLHDRTVDVKLVDIAFKGALVQTAQQMPLVPQEGCSLILPLTEGGDAIVMVGKIVHLEAQHIGIECLDIDVTSLTRLRRLVELNIGDSDLMDRELANLFTAR